MPTLFLIILPPASFPFWDYDLNLDITLFWTFGNNCRQPWLADTPIELETSTCNLPHCKSIRTEFYKLFIQPFDWPRVSVCVKFHVFDTFFLMLYAK